MPQELKRLLEARANPDIVVTTEIWGGICPLAKVIAFAKAAVTGGPPLQAPLAMYLLEVCSSSLLHVPS